MRLDPEKSRNFATHVVRQLREAGYEALWAGGCVRDQLLGRVPKDYDVATNARPDEIRRTFGRRRTLPIGAAFGVITVLPPEKDTGPIEVATFRCDAQYSDGRHPDSVTFSTAEEDARRRDFTINGVFYDPLEEKVIDYVRGEVDLEQGVVRAIGDPLERIAEDKLRMLRGVRFAATFGFQLDEATHRAILSRAGEISVVSAERIAAELQRMLVHENRAAAVDLLAQTGLLQQILPEVAELNWIDQRERQANATWQRTLRLLERLGQPPFAVALAGMLRELYLQQNSPDLPHAGRAGVEAVCRRWKLSNDDTKTVVWTLKHEPIVHAARHLPWSQLQPLLIQERIIPTLLLASAGAEARQEPMDGVEFCRAQLRRPSDELDPDPLIDGSDLLAAGIPRGPIYKSLLQDVRDAQLDGKIVSRAEAIRHVEQVRDSHRDEGA